MMIWTFDVKPLKGKKMALITPEKLRRLPSGTVLYDVEGKPAIVGTDPIDMDTRSRYLAYGVLLGKSNLRKR